MRSFPLGTFGSTDSNAVFRVQATPEGQPRVEAWDRSDGERFKVTGAVWDGKELRFTTTMPSNSFVVHHRWRPAAEGASYQGWRSSTGRPYALNKVDAKPTT